MDPNNKNKNIRTTPQYAMYQRHNFWKSNTGENPLFNTGMCSTPLEHLSTLMTTRPWQAGGSGQGEAHSERMVLRLLECRAVAHAHRQ